MKWWLILVSNPDEQLRWREGYYSPGTTSMCELSSTDDLAGSCPIHDITTIGSPAEWKCWGTLVCTMHFLGEAKLNHPPPPAQIWPYLVHKHWKRDQRLPLVASRMRLRKCSPDLDASCRNEGTPETWTRPGLPPRYMRKYIMSLTVANVSRRQGYVYDILVKFSGISYQFNCHDMFIVQQN